MKLSFATPVSKRLPFIELPIYSSTWDAPYPANDDRVRAFETGIDINPGAQIGPSFFIDHGTGVVIGETCVIGSGVRLYQGVTLGALSFQKDSEGEIVRGTKRHPTLEDDVIVYANATVLGGNTTVGARSVIGSNVWLTQSVAPDTVVVMEKPALKLKGSTVPQELGGMYHISNYVAGNDEIPRFFNSAVN